MDFFRTDHENARVFVEQTENILKSGRGRIKIQDLLEKIRAYGGFVRKYTRLLHNIIQRTGSSIRLMTISRL